MILLTRETGTMQCLRPGILCLALALAACSHDKVEATEPAKTESAAIIPAVKKPESTAPAAPESTTREPDVTKPAEGTTATNELATLKPGQSTSIDASTMLHYVRLVSDSRCPVGTQCIWAGEATIELALESGKEKQTFTLTDRSKTKEVMGFGVELVSIDRGHLINIRARKL